MKTKLRLALLLVLTLALALPATYAQAAYYPSYSVYVYDAAGQSVLSDNVAIAATGHKLYPRITNLMYVGSRYSIKWSSNKPSVASVSSKGVVTCKKAGAAVISVHVKNKSNGLGLRTRFGVGVLANSAIYTGMSADLINIADQYNTYVASSKKVYQKGGKVRTKLYIYNGTSKTLKKSVSLDMSFTDNTEASPISYMDLGVRKVSLAKSIPPHSLGASKELNLGKIGGFNSKLDWLRWSYVLAANPALFKGAAGTKAFSSLRKSQRAALARMLEQQSEPLVSLDGDAVSAED